MSARLRIATPADAGDVAAIYAPIVESTPISFELDPPAEAEMRERIVSSLRMYPWLVLERDGRLDGYAYAGQLRTRAAYRWSAETTVYVASESRRRGVARSLYSALLECLAVQGFAAVYAGITLPNDASVALHEALGFRAIGVFPGVGYKQGAWHDVGFWQRWLRERPDAPEAPRPFAELVDSAEMRAAIESVAC